MFCILFASQTFLLKLFPSWSTCFRNVFNEDLLVTNCLQFCLSENIFIELLLLKYIFATFKVSWHLIPFSVLIPWLWYQQSICYLFAIRCFLLDDFKIFLSSVFSSLMMSHVLTYPYLCCLIFTELPDLRKSVFCYFWKTPHYYTEQFLLHSFWTLMCNAGRVYGRSSSSYILLIASPSFVFSIFIFLLYFDDLLYLCLPVYPFSFQLYLIGYETHKWVFNLILIMFLFLRLIICVIWIYFYSFFFLFMF